MVLVCIDRRGVASNVDGHPISSFANTIPETRFESVAWLRARDLEWEMSRISVSPVVCSPPDDDGVQTSNRPDILSIQVQVAHPLALRLPEPDLTKLSGQLVQDVSGSLQGTVWQAQVQEKA